MEKITLGEILQKAKKRKISCDINEKTLEMVDEMAKILGIRRSRSIDVLLIQGILAHTNLSINEWELEKNKEEYKNKKEDIEKIIENLRKFKKKWRIENLKI